MKSRTMLFVVAGVLLSATAFTYHFAMRPKGSITSDSSEKVHTVQVSATVEFPK